MSLQDKINAQLNGFSIKAPDPKTSHPWHLEHLHADFLELVALFWDKNSYLTLQQAITYYKDYDFQIDFEEVHLLQNEASSSVAEKNDKWVTVFKEIFYVLEERYLAYEDAYPFEIKNFKIKLKDSLNETNKLYLYLLVSSNLNNFEKLEDILTSEFETLSKTTLSSYFPNMHIEEFGQNTGFKGNTLSKIQALSSALNVKSRVSELKQLSENANKEKGLDIVGWQKFQDTISNMIIVLGQCACGKNWTKKRGDTDDYENSYLDFHRLRPIHAMFIPYGLVSCSDTFYQSAETNGRLLFERKRIIDLLKDHIDDFKSLKSYLIIQQLVGIEKFEV